MRKLLFAALVGSLGVTGVTAAPAEADTSSVSKKSTVALDTGFGTAGVAAVPLSATEGDRFVAVAPASGGKWYTSGYVTTAGDQAMAVTRLNANGSIDTTFGTAGTATVNVAVGGKTVELGRSVAVQSDGQVLVAGPIEKDPTATGDAARDTDIAVVRFTSAGKLDPTFGVGGISKVDIGPGAVIPPTGYVGDVVWNLEVLPNDKFVAIGATKSPTAGRTDLDYAVVGFTKNGALDKAFGTDGITLVDNNGGGDSPRGIHAMDDGTIVGVGYSNVGGVVSPVLFQLSAKGKQDRKFGVNGIGGGKVLASVTEAYDVGFQGSKFITAGYGTDTAGGKVDIVVVRWTKKGTLDKSFGTNGYARVDVAGDDDRARDVVVLPDGRILIAGSGKLTATELDAMLVLFDKNGASVSSFGASGRILTNHGGPNDAYFGVAVNNKGTKAVAAGYKGAAATSGDDAVAVGLSLRAG